MMMMMKYETNDSQVMYIYIYIYTITSRNYATKSMSGEDVFYDCCVYDVFLYERPLDFIHTFLISV